MLAAGLCRAFPAEAAIDIARADSFWKASPSFRNFRDNLRIAVADVFFKNFCDIWNIHIRGKYKQRRSYRFPNIHNLRNRTARRPAYFYPVRRLLQPGIYIVGYIQFLLASRRYTFDRSAKRPGCQELRVIPYFLIYHIHADIGRDFYA